VDEIDPAARELFQLHEAPAELEGEAFVDAANDSN
jgi:hypothetical protein